MLKVHDNCLVFPNGKQIGLVKAGRQGIALSVVEAAIASLTAEGQTTWGVAGTHSGNFNGAFTRGAARTFGRRAGSVRHYRLLGRFFRVPRRLGDPVCRLLGLFLGFAGQVAHRVPHRFRNACSPPLLKRKSCPAEFECQGVQTAQLYTSQQKGSSLNLFFSVSLAAPIMGP